MRSAHATGIPPAPLNPGTLESPEPSSRRPAAAPRRPRSKRTPSSRGATSATPRSPRWPRASRSTTCSSRSSSAASNGRYQLISGERRLRAAKHAGWTTIPARVREADDRLVAELAIVENLQRKDLNPVEKALSFKRYLDEHRCTQDDLARRLKIDRSTIANLMRLWSCPAAILDGLRKGTITAGHARALLPLGDEHEQVALAERIEAEGLSVRDVERIVGEQVGEDDEPRLPARSARPRQASSEPRSDQIASLEQEFRHALGTKVEIRAIRPRPRQDRHPLRRTTTSSTASASN